jgi:hypothetical protein
MTSPAHRPERGGLRAVPTPAPRRKGERRPAPSLSPAYAHLSVEDLRASRAALADEENKVSYWRRILQARLDVVVSGTAARAVEHERLAPVLATERISAGRAALVQVLPVDGIPPLPRLGELWDRQVATDDELGRAAFAHDLQAAEGEPSAYRSALHERIAEVTGELIARYREDPSLCLSALPLPRTSAGS